MIDDVIKGSTASFAFEIQTLPPAQRSSRPPKQWAIQRLNAFAKSSSRKKRRWRHERHG